MWVTGLAPDVAGWRYDLNPLLYTRVSLPLGIKSFSNNLSLRSADLLFHGFVAGPVSSSRVFIFLLVPEDDTQLMLRGGRGAPAGTALHPEMLRSSPSLRDPEHAHGDANLVQLPPAEFYSIATRTAWTTDVFSINQNPYATQTMGHGLLGSTGRSLPGPCP